MTRHCWVVGLCVTLLLVGTLACAFPISPSLVQMGDANQSVQSRVTFGKYAGVDYVRFEAHLSYAILGQLDRVFGRTDTSPERAQITLARAATWWFVLCALAMGLGTAIGGWSVVKTVGFGLTKLQPVHGFAAETAAASAIQVASLFGVPLSTTHTITTAIMGVGASRRLSAVRWVVGRNIVAAWVLTFPICGVLGALFEWPFRSIL